VSFHEAALAVPEVSSSRNRIIKRVELVFVAANSPIKKTHCVAANTHRNQLTTTLCQRTVDLAASNRFLKQDIAQRKGMEQALKKNVGYYARLVEKSRRLAEHLRQQTHHLLSAQEDRRTKVSRELRDEIAQTLLGINVRLLALKRSATVSPEDFREEIASTQRLVEESVKAVHRFAREFGNSSLSLTATGR